MFANFLKKILGSVGMKIFLFYFIFWKAIKNAGSAKKKKKKERKKNRVGRVSGNTGIF